MAKLPLNDVASGYNRQKINDNFTGIEAEFQDKVLYRDNPDGEPNQMETDLDMNSQRIYNLPDGTENSHPATYRQLVNALDAAYDGFTVRIREARQNATAGQTVFNFVGITYVPGVNNIQVYVNGVAQVAGIDYTETDEDTITFSSGLEAGDAVDVYSNEPVTNISVTDPIVQAAVATLEDEVEKRVIRVPSRTKMKAYDVPAGYQFSLEEGGRSGIFVVKSGTPPSDPQEGIYVVLDNGNYAMRRYDGLTAGSGVSVKWFGLESDSPSAGQSAEFQNILDSYTSICIPKNTSVLLDATVTSQDGTRFFGGGRILVDNINGIKVGSDTEFDDLSLENTASGGGVSFNALAIRMDASGSASGMARNLSGLTIRNCRFLNMFYSSYATGDATYRVSDIRIEGTKSVAPVGANAGHFQHRYADRCYAIGNECFNGQNASSYNYVNDCHDILVSNNYDDNNSYASCEIENSGSSPARAIVVNNVFNGVPGIWIDDSSDVLLDGNTLSDGILITTQIVAVDNVRISDNIMTSLSAGDFSTPDPAAEITNLIVNNNTTTGGKAWAFLFDDFVKSFQLYDNTCKGSYSSGAVSLVRSSDTDGIIRNNEFGVSSVISGSGGNLKAYNNDIFTNQASTNSEAQFNSVNLSSVLPEQNEIAGTATEDYTFLIPITPQFSGRILKIYGVCRNGASGNVDSFVVYGHTFYQTSRLATLGTITRTGATSASDVSISAAYSSSTATHDTLTLSVTNNNASDVIKCRIHVDVGTRIQ